ncbi:MAG TPA: hypothetical protein VNL98_10095 [Gemmatimonadales bacterium]|nr:hypothetical protein [Gemmatimonadales bacterium]
MRRVAFGFLWLIVLYEVPLILGGSVAGAIATSSRHGNFSDGYALGQQAGRPFGEHWGGLIFLAALVVTLVGTMGRWLPGTRVRASVRA